MSRQAPHKISCGHLCWWYLSLCGGNRRKHALRSSHALQWHSLRAVKTNRNQDKISVRCLLWRMISREGRWGLIAGVKEDWRKNCAWTSEQKNSVPLRRFSLTQFARFPLYAPNVNCWRAPNNCHTLLVTISLRTWIIINHSSGCLTSRSWPFWY